MRLRGCLGSETRITPSDPDIPTPGRASAVIGVAGDDWSFACAADADVFADWLDVALGDAMHRVSAGSPVDLAATRL